MILPDVNVLASGYREDAPAYAWCRPWLMGALAGAEPVALADPVLTGFLRVVTHHRIFTPATPIEAALELVDALTVHPNAVRVAAGPRTWRIFTRLCREADATGNLVPDAYLAALAIDSGAELVSSDRDFARFRGLRWRHPRDAS